MTAWCQEVIDRILREQFQDGDLNAYDVKIISISPLFIDIMKYWRQKLSKITFIQKHCFVSKLADYFE